MLCKKISFSTFSGKNAIHFTNIMLPAMLNTCSDETDVATTQDASLFKPGRPARTWFLEIVSVQTSVCVCVCVCVSAPRLLITSGVMWRDMDPI